MYYTLVYASLFQYSVTQDAYYIPNRISKVILPGLCRIWGTKVGLIMGGRTGGTEKDTQDTVSVNQTRKRAQHDSKLESRL